jgi:hypothetical protein
VDHLATAVRMRRRRLWERLAEFVERDLDVAAARVWLWLGCMARVVVAALAQVVGAVVAQRRHA